MDKFEVLNKYFDFSSFRDVQESAIDALLNNEKVLCLMPTGGGKSLIYQVAGLCKEKTTVVISPLVALMSQQHKQMIKLGLCSVNFSGMDYKKQFKTLTDMATGEFPKFIFVSPERISCDGYLEYLLSLRRSCIGLVVIDEVHCVSQWGEGFRPAYRNIPVFLDRIFGDGSWPSLLCLTATLNEKEQEQVKKDFKITKVEKCENLWRENLKLEIVNLKSGKDDTKDEELERLLDKHVGEKILVFVHRKYGNHGTTRTLYEQYKEKYEGIAYFDSDMTDTDKEAVLNGFTDGTVKIVMATSAFGMGVDIPDIRVVINYLISETVEQYYQEVGRAGRDGKIAYGYLLFTNQSKRGRRALLNNTLCTEKSLKDEYEERKMKPGEEYKHISYDNMAEEQRVAFSLLIEYGVVSIVAKGVQSLKCFAPKTEEGKKFLCELDKYSKTGLVKIVARKSNKSINALSIAIWDMCVKGHLVLKSAPSKTLFYTINNELDDSLIKIILEDQNQKKQKRVIEFDKFVSGIETGMTPEQLVRQTLDI